MTDYNDLSQQYDVKRILKAISDGKKIVIYGGGDAGYSQLLCLKEIGIDVYCLLDANVENAHKKWKSTSLKIYTPQEFLTANDIPIFIICATINKTIAEDMRSTLEAYGLKENIDFYWERRNLFTPLDSEAGFGRVPYRYRQIDSFERKIIVISDSSADEIQQKVWFQKSVCCYLKDMIIENRLKINLINAAVQNLTSGNILTKIIRDVIDAGEKNVSIIAISGIVDANNAFALHGYPFINRYHCNIRDYLTDDSVTYYLGEHSELSPSEFFINNVRMMNACCKEFDIPFLCFVQPYAYYGAYKFSSGEKEEMEKRYPLTANDSSENYALKALNFYNEVEEQIKRYPYIVSLTNAFDGKSNCYRKSDPNHTNDNGNKLLAEKMFNEMNLKSFL